MPRAEATVDGAVALPQNQTRAPKLVGGVAAEFLRRVPQRHLFEGDAELDAGVAAQVLVWEEEELIGLGEILVEEWDGVRRSADDAFVLAAEGFDRGAGVHVGDGHDAEVFEDADGLKLLPGVLDLLDGSHVGHRAARAEARSAQAPREKREIYIV